MVRPGVLLSAALVVIAHAVPSFALPTTTPIRTLRIGAVFAAASVGAGAAYADETLRVSTFGVRENIRVDKVDGKGTFRGTLTLHGQKKEVVGTRRFSGATALYTLRRSSRSRHPSSGFHSRRTSASACTTKFR